MSSNPVDGDGSSETKPAESIEFLLFDSLCHHLVEKGLLSKNDTLSVIQTVALVVQGRMDAGQGNWWTPLLLLNEPTEASRPCQIDMAEPA